MIAGTALRVYTCEISLQRNSRVRGRPLHNESKATICLIPLIVSLTEQFIQLGVPARPPTTRAIKAKL